MSSFIRLAICGSLLEFSTGLMLPKKIDLTPDLEFQMSMEMCFPDTEVMRPHLVQEDTTSMASEGWSLLTHDLGWKM